MLYVRPGNGMELLAASPLLSSWIKERVLTLVLWDDAIPQEEEVEWFDQHAIYNYAGGNRNADFLIPFYSFLNFLPFYHSQHCSLCNLPHLLPLLTNQYPALLWSVLAFQGRPVTTLLAFLDLDDFLVTSSRGEDLFERSEMHHMVILVQEERGVLTGLWPVV